MPIASQYSSIFEPQASTKCTNVVIWWPENFCRIANALYKFDFSDGESRNGEKKSTIPVFWSYSFLFEMNSHWGKMATKPQKAIEHQHYSRFNVIVLVSLFSHSVSLSPSPSLFLTLPLSVRLGIFKKLPFFLCLVWIIKTFILFMFFVSKKREF